MDRLSLDAKGQITRLCWLVRVWTVRCAWGLSAALVVNACFGAALGQSRPSTPAETKSTANPELDPAAYQNQQRARRLLQMDAEIKNLPDVQVRCHLRSKILEFVYSKNVRSEYGAAEHVLNAFFEDMATHEKELGLRKASWANSLALLLRKHAPDLAKRIEAAYVKEVDTSPADYEDLKAGADPAVIAERVIARINKGAPTNSLPSIYDLIKRRDDAAADRILTALLDRSEKHPDIKQLSQLFWLAAGPNRQPSDTAVELKNRYYRHLVNMAGTDDGEILSGQRYFVTSRPLDAALPGIKDLDPELYKQAKAAIERRRKLLPEIDQYKERLSERIAASDDPLEQWIAEAEAAKDPTLRDYFWTTASLAAMKKRYYNKAVDLLMNGSPNLGYPDQPNARDDRLRFTIVRDASEKRDPVSAEYAIDHIANDLVRAKAMMEEAGEVGRWEPENRERYAAIIIKAFQLLENGTVDADVICLMGNSVNDWIRFTRADPIRAAEVRSRAIAIANRIPLPDPAAKPGTPERSKYVSTVLARALGCVEWLVRPPAGASVPIVPVELVDQVKIREWRLAAQIQAETARFYPLPQR